MPKYLSLLRGINVSGQKKILMKDLKSLFEESGFKNVKTYIQSGNVIFESRPVKNLSQKIEQKIADKYNFQVPVLIRTVEEMATLIKKNPLVKEKNIDQKRLYVTLLAEKPANEYINKLMEVNYEPEKFIITDKEVYIYCPDGYGEAKFSNNFIEKKLNTKGTTRNWKVINELYTLMKD